LAIKRVIVHVNIMVYFPEVYNFAHVFPYKNLAAEAFLGMFWKKKSDWSNSPQPPINH